MGGALAVTRKKRAEINARLDQLASASLKRNDAIERGTKVKKERLITYIERILLVKADHPWETAATPGALILGAIMSGGFVWLVCFHVFGIAIVLAAPASAAASFLMPRTMLMLERARIERAFTDLFPDAIDTAMRILRAGLPVTSAMRSIARESPPPINSVFATLSNQIEIGIPFEEALRLSSRQIGLADYRFFTVAVALEQSAGGNLVSTLEVISNVMRKRRAVRLRAKAITSEIRYSAYILGSLPFMIIAALLVVSPDYLTPLFTDPRGHMILAAAAGCMITCLLVMRQMMRSVTSP